MSLLQGPDTIRLVRTGPSLRERVEQRIATIQHEAVIGCLRRFRERLERETEPEPWTVIEIPMVLVLFDVCEALGLTDEECTVVLGKEGTKALHRELALRPTLLADVLNERQVVALTCLRKHGEITLSTYRAICPHWSDETLRLDLADLVARGLLVKNGTKKGTSYALPEAENENGLVGTGKPEGDPSVLVI
jgi:hypothetical protein